QPAHATDQVQGQGARSGTDLDHHVFGREVAMPGDALGQIRPHQEVLAEALARGEAAGGQLELESRQLAAFEGGPLADVGGGAAGSTEAETAWPQWGRHGASVEGGPVHEKPAGAVRVPKTAQAWRRGREAPGVARRVTKPPSSASRAISRA